MRSAEISTLSVVDHTNVSAPEGMMIVRLRGSTSHLNAENPAVLYRRTLDPVPAVSEPVMAPERKGLMFRLIERVRSREREVVLTPKTASFAVLGE